MNRLWIIFFWFESFDWPPNSYGVYPIIKLNEEFSKEKWFRPIYSPNDLHSIYYLRFLLLLHLYPSVNNTIYSVRHSHESFKNDAIYGKYKKCTVTMGLDWRVARVPDWAGRALVISQGIEREKEKKIEKRRFLNWMVELILRELVISLFKWIGHSTVNWIRKSIKETRSNRENIQEIYIEYTQERFNDSGIRVPPAVGGYGLCDIYNINYTLCKLPMV